MSNIVINGGQLSTNVRNVKLTITSPTLPYVWASETDPGSFVTGDVGSNWINTNGVDPFTMNFILSPGIATKTVYVYFSTSGSGDPPNPAAYPTGDTIADSIDLYENIQLPTITSPINGAEVTNRVITVEGTAEPGSTVTIKVEAIS